MPSYWAPTLATELTQGDLLTDVWIGSSVNPRKGLQRGNTGAKGVQNWTEGAWKEDSSGIGHFLARGRNLPLIVLSHSCELDKAGGAVPVLVAPAFPLSNVQSSEQQDKVRSGGRYAFHYLPAIPGVIDESYVDLRMISYVVRPLIDSGARMASVSDQGAEELVAKIVAFFTRVDLRKISLPDS